MQQCYPPGDTIVFVEGKNVILQDIEGRTYLDCFSGVAVNNVGQCHPKVVKAIQEQAAKMLHVAFLYHNVPMITLAEKLVQVSPKGLTKCFFAGGGAEAVEGAVKLAKKYAVVNGKAGLQIISLEHSFHGRTALALTLTGQSKYKVNQGAFANVPGVIYAPAPYCYRCVLEYPDCGLWCAKFIEEVIELKTTKQVAAFIMETVLGEGGIIVPPKEYLTAVRKICDEYGILLILDEIQSGCGRVGKMFACEHYEVTPDIMVVGKGVGGGMPLSAVVAKEKVAAAWTAGDHTHTFSGHPVVCAAGIAALEVLAEEKLPENAEKVGSHILQGLHSLKEKHALIGDVRGLGLMIGVELVKDRKKKTPATEEASKIKSAMVKRGILIGVGGLKKNVLRIQPPLTLTVEHADMLIDALDKSFTELS
ncbi:aspartate aminotransferase family protein [Candidatus Hecatella orcuttiae]|uniref:aspartate aminotransferase family protein n=1 Tax=Candidatus Hecatella orcuttiae TaxID=1935119 RepID=UPI002867BAAB|nr:aspartate aminotransferase family protein [Candidatus Hecatella orcuttiae]